MTTSDPIYNPQAVAAPPDFSVLALSAYPFEQTLVLLKQGIQANQLMLLHEINTQQIMQKAGIFTPGLLQLLFFHPRFMQRLLATNSNAILEAPLKLVAMEAADGIVTVRYTKPSYLFGRYDGLLELGEELEELVGRIVTITKG